MEDFANIVFRKQEYWVADAPVVTGIYVEYRDGQLNAGQGVHVHVDAYNENSNKVHRRHVGWLSRTMVLHVSPKCPAYAADFAAHELERYSDAIRSALVAAGREMAEAPASGITAVYSA